MLSRRGFLKNMALTGIALAYGNAFGSTKNKVKTDALFPVRVNGKGGYIDIEGNLVIKPQFDVARDFREGLGGVRVGDKCGYIDRNGEFIIKPILEYASDFSEGLAAVMPSGSNKWGYMDKAGNMVIDPCFEEESFWSDFSEGLSAAKINGKWGYIDKTGNWVINPGFEHACSFSEGLACVKAEGKWGYIDKKGIFVIPPIYGSAATFRFSEGLAQVGYGERENMYIDRIGRVAIMNEQFESVYFFNEGIAGVLIKGKQGYINKDGQIIISPKFDCGSCFSEGCAVIGVFKGKNGFEDAKDGFINKNGDIVIEPRYDFALPFENGLAFVRIDNKRGYINKAGGYVWEPTA